MRNYNESKNYRNISVEPEEVIDLLMYMVTVFTRGNLLIKIGVQCVCVLIYFCMSAEHASAALLRLTNKSWKLRLRKKIEQGT